MALPVQYDTSLDTARRKTAPITYEPNIPDLVMPAVSKPASTGSWPAGFRLEDCSGDGIVSVAFNHLSDLPEAPDVGTVRLRLKVGQYPDVPPDCRIPSLMVCTTDH